MKKRELLAMIQALEARVLFLETAKPFRYVDGTTGDPWHPFSGATCGDVGPQTTASSADTVRIPAEKIAEANAESSFVGGLARDPSNPVGWMIDGEFVENPNAGNPQVHTSGFVQVVGDLPPATNWQVGTSAGETIAPETTPKQLNAKEFRDLGLLQEVNRRFFHPLGLAMFVNIDEETGEETIGGIYDERHDPEGFFYGDIDIEKVKSVKAIEDSRREARIQKLGYWVEPVELSPDTAVIPPETIAKSNAPIGRVVDSKSVINDDGSRAFECTIEFDKSVNLASLAGKVAAANAPTHERGTGYPITESDESKRIAEAVANTPHSC